MLRLCPRVPQACDTPQERIVKMLKMLPKRGSDTYDKFIKVLLSVSHGHVAKKLRVTEGIYYLHYNSYISSILYSLSLITLFITCL